MFGNPNLVARLVCVLVDVAYMALVNVVQSFASGHASSWHSLIFDCLWFSIVRTMQLLLDDEATLEDYQAIMHGVSAGQHCARHLQKIISRGFRLLKFIFIRTHS